MQPARIRPRVFRSSDTGTQGRGSPRVPGARGPASWRSGNPARAPTRSSRAGTSALRGGETLHDRPSSPCPESRCERPPQSKLVKADSAITIDQLTMARVGCSCEPLHYVAGVGGSPGRSHGRGPRLRLAHAPAIVGTAPPALPTCARPGDRGDHALHVADWTVVVHIGFFPDSPGLTPDDRFRS